MFDKFKKIFKFAELVTVIILVYYYKNIFGLVQSIY